MRRETQPREDSVPRRLDDFPMAVEDVEKPELTTGAVAAFLADRYGLAGALTPLGSERDQIFRVEAGPDASFIVRITAAAERPETLDLQDKTLLTIARRDPGLPVPRHVPSVAGQNTEFFVDGSRRHAVRVFRYLEGVPIGETAPTPARWRAAGTALARLDRVLAGVDHPAPGHAFLWDVRNAPALRPLFSCNPDAGQRRLFDTLLGAFEADVLPAVLRLRHQLIHHDFTARNLLVDPDRPGVVTGIIDFGDLARSALVVDLAIAVARQVTRARPVEDAAGMVAAYHRVLPLEASEVAMIHPLVCARLMTRITVWTWRRSRGEPRSFGMDLDEAADLLDAFLAAGSTRVGDVLRDACRPGVP
jgi:hydroxylysine kinase